MQEKNRIRKLLSNRVALVCYHVLFLLFAGTWLWTCYLCPDARYVKDNLEYVRTRMVEAGVDCPADAPQPLDGLGVNLYRLHYLTESWTTGYLHAAASSGNEEVNKEHLQANPYDTLSRLVLDANSSDVETVYQDIQFCAAACEDSFRLNAGTLNLLYAEKQPYCEAAVNACSAQNVLFFVLFGLTVASFGIAILMDLNYFMNRKKEEETICQESSEPSGESSTQS